ncbi:MAG: hypothetical protein RLZZ574_2654 [Cyanobacteriota bacterium]|jgi:hypothetical protein
MSCDNLCTAAKCEELENRISALEQTLELIQAAFEAHTQQDIPQAHNYNPPPADFEIPFDLIVNYVLIRIQPTLQIIIDDLNFHIGSDYTTVHNYKSHKSNLRIDGSFASEILYLTVADGESQDTASISIPLPEIPKYEPRVQVDADIYQGTLAINVMVDDASDIATIDLPVYEPQVQVDADIYQGTLAINVMVDDASDIATIDLPIEQHKKSNLRIDGSFASEILYLTVADGESQDTVTIHIPTHNNGGGGIGPDGCGIDLVYKNNLLTANLTVGQCSSSDSTKIMEFSPIQVEQITCKDGVAESKIVTVAVIKGTEAAELEAYAARAKLLKTQCELEPVAAAPDWWQVRLGGNRPQIVCVFRKQDSRTYHSLAIPHPANVELPTEPILPAYQKGNIQGMIVLNDNSKFIVNCISESEAVRMCNIAASKIIASYLPNPYKVWITERKGEPVGKSSMKPTSILYFSQGQKNLKPDWRFAIPPDLEPS